ncbi:MAG: hydrogenase iron-sulfur subunit [Candidatus Eisenbacteria bacterium]
MKKVKEEKSETAFKPRIVAFVCKWCTGVDGAPGANVRVISVMCSGRVSPSLVLKAFELGADGVMVCGCEPGNCHYTFGNEKQGQMFETSKKLADVLGLEPARLKLQWLSPKETDGLGRSVGEFTKEILKVGPSPLRK